MLTLDQAAQALQQHALIAYPTEAVYGLGCLAHADQAIERVLQLKARDRKKGIILIAAELSQLDDYIAPLSHEQAQALSQQRAHPTTWVVPAHSRVSSLLTGGRNTLAVRLTTHPIAQSLCYLCQSPLLSTSANLSGQPTLDTPAEINAAFGAQIAGVVEGSLGAYTRPSDIIELATGRQLR